MSSRFYAIGDVHGRSDLLACMIQFVENHARITGHEPRVIFLGDIVDRGPDSRGAIDIVLDTIDRWPNSKLILGNHDEMFLKSVTDPSNTRVLQNWCYNGGTTTLASYFGPHDEFFPDEVASIGREFPRHIELIKNASIIETVGRYAFVHAGIDPKTSLFEQKTKNCLWIRDEFLDHIGPLSHTIVHGHTIIEGSRPIVTENRISLDTGAYHTGILSMAAIDPDTDSVEFFSTTQGGGVRAIEPMRIHREFEDKFLSVVDTDCIPQVSDAPSLGFDFLLTTVGGREVRVKVKNG